ncbi:hypothetical protein CC86DRAFT_417364 [Ophiobolus disseminans]|uniref:Uncharacterized protein n=1 Tax=Ophiobolus disseminans TaxID=1469910 RepID=A0A6A7A0I5_9PLEO|nr:hypothetical protein CC86DRAFT_417364 [Ophiobolus disseminans]
MPKHSATQKLGKQAAHRTPTTKSRCNHLQRVLPRGAPGHRDRDRGPAWRQAPADYSHIKANGTVYARKVAKRNQGALSSCDAAVTTKELLDKIVTNLKLESAMNIFPGPFWAPRQNNFNGEKATAFDTSVSGLPPIHWPGTFTAALYQLSKVAKHDEALAAMINAATERHKTRGHKQQAIMEVLTQDVKLVTENFAGLCLADKAVNAQYTEKMVGGLSGALLKATLQGAPGFAVAVREDEKPRDLRKSMTARRALCYPYLYYRDTEPLLSLSTIVSSDQRFSTDIVCRCITQRATRGETQLFCYRICLLVPIFHAPVYITSIAIRYSPPSP